MDAAAYPSQYADAHSAAHNANTAPIGVAPVSVSAVRPTVSLRASSKRYSKFRAGSIASMRPLSL